MKMSRCKNKGRRPDRLKPMLSQFLSFELSLFSRKNI